MAAYCDHEPGHSRAGGRPRCSSTSRVWQAVTPEPQEETTSAPGRTPTASSRARGARRPGAAGPVRRRSAGRAGGGRPGRGRPGGRPGPRPPCSARPAARRAARRRPGSPRRGRRGGRPATAPACGRPAAVAARLRSTRAVPAEEPAVQQGCRAAGRPQHPHQARRHHAARVVVGHHDVVVRDPGAPRPAANTSGVGQRVATGGGGGGARRGSGRGRRTPRRAGGPASNSARSERPSG